MKGHPHCNKLIESANDQDNNTGSYKYLQHLKERDLFAQIGKRDLYFIVDPFFKLAKVPRI